MRKMLNKKREGMSSDEISKGTLTLSSPRCKCQENEESQLDDSPVSKVGDKKVEEMIEIFQNEQLQKMYEASRGETTTEAEQGGQNKIECDPSARWDVLDIAREGSHIWEYFPKKKCFFGDLPLKCAPIFLDHSQKMMFRSRYRQIEGWCNHLASEATCPQRHSGAPNVK